MKKLEKTILDKIFKIETKKTASYFITKFIILVALGFAGLIFSTVILEIFREQGSFDLLEFLDWDNILVFYQEAPKELLLIFFLVIIFLAYLIFMVVKNYGKIKNKLVSIYKFYKRPPSSS